MKIMQAKAQADELNHLYQDEAIDEGIVRAHEAATGREIAEAQRWLSAVFLLARRFRKSRH